MTNFVSVDPLNALTNLVQRPIFIGANRNPTTLDVQPPQTTWQNQSTLAGPIYTSLGAGVWVVSSGSSGDVLTINNLAPTGAGNITIAGTAAQILASNAGSTVTFSIPAVFIAPGSIAATTTLTATLGAITATNGNLVFGTAGNKILSTSVGTTTAAGANSFGSVTLVGGSAIVATTAVTANSLIFLSRQSVGATGAAALGILSVGTINAATNFVINAWTTANATVLVATDVSVVSWMIVN